MKKYKSINEEIQYSDGTLTEVNIVILFSIPKLLSSSESDHKSPQNASELFITLFIPIYRK